jgi:hypothetical protein
MAGKAGRSGGIRQGAGRKPQAIEDNVKKVIKEALDRKGSDAMAKVWEKIIEKAMAGSDKHAQILLNYYHGKPKENLEQPTELVINVKRS